MRRSLQETMQLKTVCDKTPISPHNFRDFWSQNFYRQPECSAMAQDGSHSGSCEL